MSEPITLTTIGSRGVTIDVKDASLPEAAGGLEIHLALPDGPLMLTLTAEEAKRLLAGILSTYAPERARS